MRVTVYAEDIEIGQSASYARTVTEKDIALFGEATGDMNPVHFDEAYAATTPFKTRIAHGMLTAGYFSAVLGTKLPGAGSIYASQSLAFKAPVRIGDEVVATCTVIAKDRRRVTLSCIATVGETVVAEGEAVLLAPARPKA